MRIDYTNFESWLAVVLACIATGIWRLGDVAKFEAADEWPS